MQHAELKQEIQALIDQVNAAFNNRDADALLALMSDDIVFEDTGPAPEGTRYVGKDQVRAFWEQFFVKTPHVKLEVEDMFVAAERAAVRHRYEWSARPSHDDPGYVRGATMYQVRDGLIVGMYPYVKG